MKHLLTITFGLLLGASAYGSSALPLYEPFPTTYGEGTRLGIGTSATVWDTGNSPGTGSATNTLDAKLSFGGLATSNSSLGILLVGTPSSNRDRGVVFVPAQPVDTNNPMLYASFLLDVQSPSSGTRLIAYLRNSTSQGNPSAGVFLNSSSQLQIVKSGTTPAAATTSALSEGSHLVVFRYRWVSDTPGDDEVALWLDPDPGFLGSEEAAIPDPTITTIGGNDVSDLKAFFIAHRTDGSGTLSLDEVRVATNWAAVTPPDGSFIPPQPRITETFISSGALILRGTNGSPENLYQVLASSNVALPLFQWSSVSTNTFDTSGNFDSTNAISPTDPQRFYRLLLGGAPPPPPSAPSITTQPANQTVTVGQNGVFSVVAGGTAPFAYQWYFNTNTLLTGATGSSLIVTNAQTTNAGGYHVVVTNTLGSATSSVATLTVNLPPVTGSPDGFAALSGGTTGGAGGPTITVNNFADFEHYVGTNVPYIVQVQGTINLGSSNVRVRDNKTIVGLGTNATLVGDLKVFRNNNVIIQNINFTNPSGAGDSDGLTLQETVHVWVDHCTFVDCDDGSLDISHGADWITVSWCHFYYTNPGNTHRFSNLIGHSDSASAAAEDTGKLHITYHHNWWGQLVHERMPRVRFGHVHCFNNYYHSPGNNYCIRAGRDSQILVENNHFDNVKNVWELFRTVGLDGKVYATNNVEVNTTWSTGDPDVVQIPGTDTLAADLSPPAYFYSPDAASLIPNLVTNSAGAGKGPFAP